jgi:hypothetical protein
LSKKNALVVNWRGSWPAGPVPGTVISDRTFPGLFKKKGAAQVASPPEVLDELRRRFDTDWRPGALSLSVSLPDYLRWELRKFINRTVEIDDYYARICLRYMKKGDYPLTVLYLHGQEALKYALLKDREKLSLADLSAAVKVLESYYVFVDRWLAKILDPFPATGHAVLIGDPGRISTRGDYMATGYLGLMGPNIRRAGFAGYAKELAVTPTLMALMGISPSEEMEEDILEEAFHGPFISELEVLGETSSYGRQTGVGRFSGREVEGYYRRELSTPEYALWKD